MHPFFVWLLLQKAKPTDTAVYWLQDYAVRKGAADAPISPTASLNDMIGWAACSEDGNMVDYVCGAWQDYCSWLGGIQALQARASLSE